MSRSLTSTQVVEKGDYLQPGFNPASLTVSQLLGVLSFHEIKFPTPYNKGKLIETFNSALKPQLARLLKDRRLRQCSLASTDGIVDGSTGQPIKEARSVRPMHGR